MDEIGRKSLKVSWINILNIFLADNSETSDCEHQVEVLNGISSLLYGSTAGFALDIPPRTLDLQSDRANSAEFILWATFKQDYTQIQHIPDFIRVEY